jgi:hypothetical protein
MPETSEAAPIGPGAASNLSAGGQREDSPSVPDGPTVRPWLRDIDADTRNAVFAAVAEAPDLTDRQRETLGLIFKAKR